jgi:hypothetical protein
VKIILLLIFFLNMGFANATDGERIRSYLTDPTTARMLLEVNKIDIDHWISLQPEKVKEFKVEINRLDRTDKLFSIYE